IALKDRLRRARHVVVVGGGFIGLEVAAVACALGCSVTVLEAQERLMPRVVAPMISEFYRALHTASGVAIVCGAGVCEIVGEGGAVREVRLSHAASYRADVVIVGIGVVPNVELAVDAGLPVHNGIAVNDRLQTADPRVYAIGDCAEYPSAFADRR